MIRAIDAQYHKTVSLSARNISAGRRKEMSGLEMSFMGIFLIASS
jgi:hypothetical protein